MLRKVALVTAMSVLACGGDAPPEPEQNLRTPTRPESSAANRAPLLQSSRIVPAQPKVGEAVNVMLKTLDPDGDPIDVSVEWFYNGRSIKKGLSQRLDTSGFSRGDQIYARVSITDGRETTTVDTAAVRIVNQAPAVTGLALFPNAPTGNDTLIVEAKAHDGDRDSFELSYAWYLNGSELFGETGPQLAPGKFKRGDEIQVSVRASDGRDAGNWLRSKPLTIRNAAPRLTSDPRQATVSAGRYEYALRAEDPDGDTGLRYSLASGPAGMTVDLVSGAVSWDVPQDGGGSHPVVVEVADPYGGRTQQSYTVDLHWETVPAKAE